MRVAKNSNLKEYGLIMIGCLLMALALNVFLEPNSIVTGGITGLAIVIKSISTRTFGFGIPIWVTDLAINIPLFLISFKVFGFKFLRKTVFATLFLSFSLFITSGWFVINNDYTIASVFGGLLTGLGLGLIFRSNATTGGSDLIASLIYKRRNNIPLAKIMLIVDVTIIIFGFFEFGQIPALYSILSAYITTKVIDVVVEGIDFAKAIFIISDKSTEIGNSIISKLDRGATSLYGQGVYSKNKKNVILCVVSRKEVAKLKEIVLDIDQNAFIIIYDAREVMGEF